MMPRSKAGRIKNAVNQPMTSVLGEAMKATVPAKGDSRSMLLKVTHMSALTKCAFLGSEAKKKPIRKEVQAKQTLPSLNVSENCQQELFIISRNLKDIQNSHPAARRGRNSMPALAKSPDPTADFIDPAKALQNSLPQRSSDPKSSKPT